jgi:hypothetical protein
LLWSANIRATVTHMHANKREGHSVPGSAGIFAREILRARLMYFEYASRAKMPALPGNAA